MCSSVHVEVIHSFTMNVSETSMETGEKVGTLIGKLMDKWKEIHWDYLPGYISLRGADSRICLRDCTCEVAGTKTSKLNSHYFSLRKSFLYDKARSNFHFSLVHCQVAPWT